MKRADMSKHVPTNLWLLIKKRLAWKFAVLLVMAGIPALCTGQIGVELKPLSSKFLLYEPVKVTMVIRNSTGRMLSFDSGQAPAQLRFDIEMAEGTKIYRINTKPLLSGDQVMTGKSESYDLAVSEFYKIQDIGLYTIQAVVIWNSNDYVSRRVYFEVVKGVELLRARAGIPGDEGAVRTYTVEYLQRDRGEYLYLCIKDDIANRLYGVFNLGRIVRVRVPVLRVDEAGNVHVLFQTIGMNFVHAAFTPYGVHLFTKNIPGSKGLMRFRELPNGKLSVTEAEAPVESNLPLPDIPEHKTGNSKSDKPRSLFNAL